MGSAKVGDRVQCQKSPILDDAYAVAEGLGLLHVMGGQQIRGASPPVTSKEFTQVVA